MIEKGEEARQDPLLRWAYSPVGISMNFPKTDYNKIFLVIFKV